ncbi:MAG: hypothetical protein M0Z53_10650 [Thermaerobacter sp.]|nr:hypothetical protein [Thermaerobacter sp.]
MEREVRIASYIFALRKTERGVQFEIDKRPADKEARQEVFAIFDQLRQAARQSGVTSPEILAYWVKNQLTRRNFVKK